MDPQRIKACIDAMAASDLAEMEFSQDGWSLRLVRRGAAGPAPAAEVVPGRAAAPMQQAVEPAVEPAWASPTLRAPLYGVVHLTPGPGEPAFVAVGQPVIEGQILCVIEAMKVFNQVRAEHDATVAEILVTPGQEVDAGQPLLRFA